MAIDEVVHDDRPDADLGGITDDRVHVVTAERTHTAPNDRAVAVEAPECSTPPECGSCVQAERAAGLQQPSLRSSRSRTECA